MPLCPSSPCSSLYLSIFCLLSCVKAAEKCVKWGNQFDVPLDTKNIVFDCHKPDGRKVCCAAVNQTFDLTRGVGTDYERFTHSSDRENVSKRVKGKCEVSKQYIPSPYELRDFQYAKDLQLITDAEVKFDKLLTYVTSDEMIVNSTKWLNRIKVHMQSEITPTPTSDDYEFLSRFHVTKICRLDAGGEVKSEWDEWIEPLSIHARHPFGFGRCRNTIKYYNQKPKTGRSDTDYVLLQSGMSLYNQAEGRRSGNRNRRNILLDAGTSTFDSSLFWFTCGYSQVCFLTYIFMYVCN